MNGWINESMESPTYHVDRTVSKQNCSSAFAGGQHSKNFCGERHISWACSAISWTSHTRFSEADGTFAQLHLMISPQGYRTGVGKRHWCPSVSERLLLSSVAGFICSDSEIDGHHYRETMTTSRRHFNSVAKRASDLRRSMYVYINERTCKTIQGSHLDKSVGEIILLERETCLG